VSSSHDLWPIVYDFIRKLEQARATTLAGPLHHRMRVPWTTASALLEGPRDVLGAAFQRGEPLSPDCDADRRAILASVHDLLDAAARSAMRHVGR
jgi:hypothetical protein